jgi:hypothetical protein
MSFVLYDLNGQVGAKQLTIAAHGTPFELPHIDGVYAPHPPALIDA